MKRLSLTEKFAMQLAKITEIEVFVGTARVLKVPLVEGEKEREFFDVFVDCLEAFNTSEKKRQKELLSILKDANKCKESINADSTKTSAEKESN